MLQDYFVKNAKTRKWSYSSETFSDDTPENLIVDSVRARLLDYLPQEIPYKLETSMEYYSVEKSN